jgi:hypothetical protein
MPSYALEWSRESGGRERTEVWSGRVYKSDASAIRAAMALFRHRSSDCNDELCIYEGRVNGWGSIDGRLVAKIVYDQLGGSFFSVKMAER